MTETLKENKFVAIYARVSTSAQEVQETIEAQLLEVRKFAKEHGYIIVKEYLDQGWSGDVLARPALDELRLDARKKLWDAVLIYDPDRLGRRYFYQELVMDELKQLGVDTLFVTVPPVKDINDRMLSGMRGLFAEYERAKISERFRLGKVSRVTKGNILVSEAPYGYTYIVNTGKRGEADYKIGHYEINEEEAENVRQMFSWVADEGLTLRGVVRRLQELGIMPRKSKRGVWSTSTLSNLFRNETYIGRALWGTTRPTVPLNPLKDQKYKKNKKTSRKMRPESDWVTIAVPRILEDDLFSRAGQKLKDNFALMGRNKKNDYMLAGKIWCTCGKRRGGEGPQQGKHLYYRCNDRVNCFPLPRACYEKGVNARIADAAVWQRFEEIMTSPELMKEQIERHKKDNQNNVLSNVVVNVENVKKEIAKLKKQVDRYNSMCSEELMTLDEVKKATAPIKERILSLEKNLVQASVMQKPKNEIVSPSDEDMKLFTREAKKITSSLSFEAKKGIMATTLTKVDSNQKSLQVYGYLNLHEIHVKFISYYRNCWATKRWEINAF